MMKSNRVRMGVLLCAALTAAACDSASPTGPTDPMTPEPEVVTLDGTWRGWFTGALVVSDSVSAELTQTDNSVTGNWSTPMPAALVLVGAPADVNLTGPVTGTVTGTTAELSFAFEGFQQYFAPGCALALTVSSFTATTMEGTWTTNASCQAPVVDSGTLSLTRQ